MNNKFIYNTSQFPTHPWLEYCAKIKQHKQDLKNFLSQHFEILKTSKTLLTTKCGIQFKFMSRSFEINPDILSTKWPHIDVYKKWYTIPFWSLQNVEVQSDNGLIIINELQAIRIR